MAPDVATPAAPAAPLARERGERARSSSRLPGLALCVAAGVVVGGASIAGTSLAPKEVVKALGGLGLLLAALLSPRPKEALLFLWIPALTYNRNYFLDFLGDHGSYGLYWNPADVFLVALLGVWLHERIVHDRAAGPVGRPLWPIFLPFAAACLVAAVDALRVDWALFDMARVLRIALVLWFVRYHVGRREWFVCLAGLGVAILVQSLLGVTYVATGQQLGLAFFLGAGAEAQAYGAMMEGVTPLAFRRAEGTMGHPNTLALYLLLTTPVFVVLALVRGRAVVRLAAGVVAVAGLAGLGATLSRTGWVLGVFQMGLLVVGLLALRRLRTKRALGAAVIGVCATLAVALPFADQIHERITGDFGEQLEFRAKHDRIALEIWQEGPLTGVGPNNYSGRLEDYGLEEVEVMIEVGEAVRTGLNLRVTAWVHNIYLLILAETGILGFTGFLVFIGGATWFAIRGVAETRGIWPCLALGLLVGLVGGHLHGLQEAALWIDPVTYTFALVVGLASNLRVLGARPRERAP